MEVEGLHFALLASCRLMAILIAYAVTRISNELHPMRSITERWSLQQRWTLLLNPLLRRWLAYGFQGFRKRRNSCSTDKPATFRDHCPTTPSGCATRPFSCWENLACVPL